MVSGAIRVDGDRLVFELRGADQFLTFQRSHSVPLAQIEAVSTERVPWHQQGELRLPVCAIPGRLKDGFYRTADGWVFFAEHDPDRCLAVTLNHARNRRIVFEVGDKERTTREIRAAVSARTRPKMLPS